MYSKPNEEPLERDAYILEVVGVHISGTHYSLMFEVVDGERARFWFVKQRPRENRRDDIQRRTKLWHILSTCLSDTPSEPDLQGDSIRLDKEVKENLVDRPFVAIVSLDSRGRHRLECPLLAIGSPDRGEQRWKERREFIRTVKCTVKAL